MLVPLLGVTWLVGSSDVTLQVDGRPHQLTTYARTVDELLDRAGVEHGPADEIVPAPATALRDGMVVEVVHAREITVMIGDEQNTVLVTALSVEEVVAQLAKRRGISQRSLVRPARFSPIVDGMTIELLKPVGVTVVMAGKEREIVTDAATVAGVLERLDVRLDRNDRVTPGLQAPIDAGTRITVERVRIKREQRTVDVVFPTEERLTDELAQGEQRVVQEGRNGQDRVVERVTFVDGAEMLRTQVSRRTVTEPQAEIVEVGTATAPPRDETAADSRERPQPEPAAEPAPAPQPEPKPEPEPEATSPDGNSQSGQASYYYHPEEGMTAAHRTLPMGTVVTVTNRANGKSIQVTINDRGPYIDGRIIDLNEQAFTQIAAKSSGVINVRISW